MKNSTLISISFHLFYFMVITMMIVFSCGSDNPIETETIYSDTLFVPGQTYIFMAGSDTLAVVEYLCLLSRDDGKWALAFSGGREITIGPGE